MKKKLRIRKNLKKQSSLSLAVLLGTTSLPANVLANEEMKNPNIVITTEDTLVEDTVVEDALVEDTKVEDTKVEDTKVEDTKVEDAEVEDAEVKDTEVKDTEVKDTEVKDDEIKDIIINKNDNLSNITNNNVSVASVTELAPNSTYKVDLIGYIGNGYSSMFIEKAIVTTDKNSNASLSLYTAHDYIDYYKSKFLDIEIFTDKNRQTSVDVLFEEVSTTDYDEINRWAPINKSTFEIPYMDMSKTETYYGTADAYNTYSDVHTGDVYFTLQIDWTSLVWDSSDGTTEEDNEENDDSNTESEISLDANSSYDVEILVCNPEHITGDWNSDNDYSSGDWYYEDAKITTNADGDAEIKVEFGVGWIDWEDCKFTDLKMYTDENKTKEIDVIFTEYPDATGWWAVVADAVFTLPNLDSTGHYHGTATAYNIEGNRPVLIGDDLDVQVRVLWDTLNKTAGEAPQETKVATPTYDEFETVFTGSTYAKFYTATTGATIKYTTDGTDPSRTNGTTYNPFGASDAEYDGIEIFDTTNFKIIAYKDGLEDSDIVTITYAKKDRLPMCTFTPIGNSFEGEIEVSINNENSNAEIYYVFLDSEFGDSKQPTKEDGILYTKPFTIDETTYIRAIAYHDDYNTSFTTVKAWELVEEATTFEKNSTYEVQLHVCEPDVANSSLYYHNLTGFYIETAEITTDANGDAELTVYFENGRDKIYSSWDDSQFSAFKVYTDVTRTTEIDVLFENITETGNDYIDKWFFPVAKATFKLPYVDAVGHYHCNGTLISTESNNKVFGDVDVQVRVDWSSLVKTGTNGDGDVEDDNDVETEVLAPKFFNATTNAEVKNGVISEAIELEMTSETEDAEIYYLIDSEELPEDAVTAQNGIKYENPIKINKTSNIKAVAIKDGSVSEASTVQIGWNGSQVLSDIVDVTYSEDNAYYNAVNMKIDDKFYREVLDRSNPLPVSEYYITVTQGDKSERHVYNGGIGGFSVDFNSTTNNGEIVLMLDKNKWSADEEIAVAITIYDSASATSPKYENKLLTMTLSDVDNTLVQKDTADETGDRVWVDELENGKTYTSEFVALNADDYEYESMLNEFFERKVKLVKDASGNLTATFRNTQFPSELLDFAIESEDGTWTSALTDGKRTEITEGGEIVAVEYEIPIGEAGGYMNAAVNVSMMGGSPQINGQYDRYTSVIVAFASDAVEGFSGFASETGLTDEKIRNRTLVAFRNVDVDGDGYVSSSDLASFRGTELHISTSEDTLLDAYSVYDENRIVDFSWLSDLPSSMTSIEIGGHKIGKIGSEFKKFTGLTNLDLTSNMIVTIEDNAFSTLSNLKSIWITSNLISEINENTFKGLSGLGEFSLTQNVLTKVPANAFSDMTKITSVGFMDNNIEVIEDGAFNGLNNVKYIFATNNKLTEFPSGLSELPNLMYLKFEHNQISEIGEKLNNLPEIYEIDIEYNVIKDLPASVFENESLRLINFTNNSMSTVPVILLEKLLSGDFYADEFIPGNQFILENSDLSSFTEAEIKKLEEYFGDYVSKSVMDIDFTAVDGKVKFSQDLSAFDYYFWSFALGKGIEGLSGTDADAYKAYREAELPVVSREAIENSILYDQEYFYYTEFVIKTGIQKMVDGEWKTIYEDEVYLEEDAKTYTHTDLDMKENDEYRFVKTFYRLGTSGSAYEYFTVIETATASSDANDDVPSDSMFEANKEYKVMTELKNDTDPNKSFVGYYGPEVNIITDENGNAMIKTLLLQTFDMTDYKIYWFKEFALYDAVDSENPIVIEEFSEPTISALEPGYVKFELPYIDDAGIYKGHVINNLGDKIDFTYEFDWSTLSEIYAERVETPVISPAGGTIYSDTYITITCDTEDAEIYYTTDGSYPFDTETGNTPWEGAIKYTEPFTLENLNSTVNAIAFKEGMNMSVLAYEDFQSGEIMSFKDVSEEISFTNETLYDKIVLDMTDSRFLDIMTVSYGKQQVSDYYISVSQDNVSERHLYNGGIGGFTVQYDYNNENGTITMLLEKGKWDASKPLNVSINALSYDKKQLELDLTAKKVISQEDGKTDSNTAEKVYLSNVQAGKTYSGSFAATVAGKPTEESMLNGFFESNVKVVTSADNKTADITFKNIVMPNDIVDFALKTASGEYVSGKKVMDASGESATFTMTVSIEDLQAEIFIDSAILIPIMGGSLADIGNYESDSYTNVDIYLDPWVFEGYTDSTGDATGLTDAKIQNRNLILIPNMDADNDGYVSPADMAAYEMPSLTNYFGEDLGIGLDLSTTFFYLENAYSSFDNISFKDVSFLKHFANKADAEVLYLEGHKIPLIKTDTFDGYENLKTLHLQANSIASIEDNSFVNLNKLEDLRLSSNKLTAITDGMFRGLTSLKGYFDLSDNNIESISLYAFKDLTNITHLYLYGNNIKTITGASAVSLINENTPVNAFSFLINLVSIDASGNEIAGIVDLTGLTKLVDVNLSDNKINEIIFDEVEVIKDVDISGNYIQEVPEILVNSETLTNLDVSKNYIQVLPEGLGSVTYLDAAQNYITEIPQFILDAELNGDGVNEDLIVFIFNNPVDLDTVPDEYKAVVDDALEYAPDSSDDWEVVTIPTDLDVNLTLEAKNGVITSTADLGAYDYLAWTTLNATSLSEYKAILQEGTPNLPVDSYALFVTIEKLVDDEWVNLDTLNYAYGEQDTTSPKFYDSDMKADDEYRIVKGYSFTPNGGASITQNSVFTKVTAVATVDEVVVPDGATFEFGSDAVSLAAGVYTIPVAMKDASNIDKDSMANGAIVGDAILTIDESGVADLDVTFGGVEASTVTGYATDIKYYDTNDTSGNLIDATVKSYIDDVVNLNKDEVPELVNFDILHKDADGFYINLYVDVMDSLMPTYSGTDAYIALDYANAELNSTPATNYTITFDSQEGSNVSNMNTNSEGVLVSLPTAPTKEGYNFVGWFTNIADGTEIKAGHKFDANTTVYARWSEIKEETGFGSENTEFESGKYILPIDMKNAGDISKPSSMDAAVGNYSVMTIDENGDAKLTIEILPVTMMGVTLYPEAFGYYTSDGIEAGSLVDFDVIESYENGKPKLIECVVTNKALDYMYINMSIDVSSVSPAAGVMNHDVYMTLDYANTKSNYAITFNSNGGSVVSNTTANVDGEIAIASLPVPTYEGFEFLGWFDAKGNEITVDTVFRDDVELIAKWNLTNYGDFEVEVIGDEIKIIAYNGVASNLVIPSSISGFSVTSIGENAFAGSNIVTVDIPEGVTEIEDNAFSNCAKLEVIKVPESLETVSSTAFAGSNAIKDVHYAGSNPDVTTALKDASNSDVHEDSTGFVVTYYNGYSNASIGSNKADIDGTLISKISNPTRVDYTFNGWFTAATGGTKIDINTYKFTENTNLYAQWTYVKATTFTIKFDSNGGTSVNNIEVASGGSIGYVPPTARYKYEFLGWYNVDTSSYITKDTTFTKDTTLIAMWQLEEDNSNSGSNSGSSSFGSSMGNNITGLPKKDELEEELLEEELLTEELLDEELENNLDANSNEGTIKFSDISGHWAYDSIQFMADRGLMSGTSTDEFSPELEVTRGMFITVLGRLSGDNVSGYFTSSFSDVSDSMYYMPYAEWAKQAGITSGVSETEFAPDLAITREQMAVLLSNYMNYANINLSDSTTILAEDSNSETLVFEEVAHTDLGNNDLIDASADVLLFADNDSFSSWSIESVSKMQKLGLLSGKDDNMFDPQGSATRAEFSSMLHRFILASEK